MNTMYAEPGATEKAPIWKRRNIRKLALSVLAILVLGAIALTLTNLPVIAAALQRSTSLDCPQVPSLSLLPGLFADVDNDGDEDDLYCAWGIENEPYDPFAGEGQLPQQPLRHALVELCPSPPDFLALIGPVFVDADSDGDDDLIHCAWAMENEENPDPFGPEAPTP